MEIEQLQREDARWKMLRVIDAGRPIGVNESIVHRILSDLELRFTRVRAAARAGPSSRPRVDRNRGN